MCQQVRDRLAVWKSNESTSGLKASVMAFVVLGLMMRTDRPVLLSVCSIIYNYNMHQ